MNLDDLEIAVSALHVEPDDWIVLRTPHKLNPQAAVVLRQALEGLFPGHRCVILEEDFQLTSESVRQR